ncbi:MAG: methyltransferase domain-containing protein [Lachnospiraceae bacterium]|nr:methyltransferase domain-containing protein [Lachnospiraceae bacterium]
MDGTIEQIIAEEISIGNWNKAVQLLQNEFENKNFSAELYILSAAINEHFNLRDEQFDSIISGLKLDAGNYELYVSLGDYYRTENPDLAYLCYENSLMLCPTESPDYNVISSIFQSFKDESTLTVHNSTFIVYSYSLENTLRCINSIRSTCASNSYEILIISNILNPNYQELSNEFSDIKIINGHDLVTLENAYNHAIKSAAPDNNIIITNDDVAMLFNSLFMLRFGLYTDGKNCISSSQPIIYNFFDSNDILSGDFAEHAKKNNIPQKSFIQYHFIIPNTCFIIRRECIEKINYFDNDFNSDDYYSYSFTMNCINLNLSSLKTGYKTMHNHSCCIVSSHEFVKLHFTNETFSEEIFMKVKNKHGFNFYYYSSSRDELISFIKHAPQQKINVLEVGCGLGSTLNTIAYKFPNTDIHGIEIVKNVAQYASVFCDIKCDDIETMKLDYPENYFDYIIFGDVLEHLRDPIAVLKKIRPYLKKGGYVLTSIPNIMNISIIFSLLSGKWEYSDSGILDRTHLRFFTLDTIKTMFSKADYTICNVGKNTNIEVDKFPKWFTDMLKDNNFAPAELFSIIQYLIKAQVNK